VSEPDTSRTATVRAIRARSSDSARFPCFIYRPEAPLAPNSTRAAASASKLA
jgi:hypothetical protein